MSAPIDRAIAARLLGPEESSALLAAYGSRHPVAWRHLQGAMQIAQSGVPDIPIVEFVPPGEPPLLGTDV